jgi:ABC-2 type transport system ATP-binding protein
MLNQRKKSKEEIPVIEVKNVTKKYGSFVAVDNISFTINDGEVVGFLGPNGAGKSTTMNMITGYIEQTEGNIIVNEFDTIKKSKKAKKEIGYMPEGVPLYTDLTVKEFVTYMAELRKVERKLKKEKVQEVLKETGLDGMQNKLIKNLSRGQKQRVSLAGTLVADPKILILDEPTVGLDPKQITEIRSLIKNLGKKHTVILSSHILSEVSQICDRVIIINNGKIVAVDTPENLEKKVSDSNKVYVTVEDKEGKIENIKEKIKGIKEIKLIKENEDKTKQYEITGESDINLNKTIFNEFAKEEITIVEMKKSEATLEDAFMKIIKEGGEK